MSFKKTLSFLLFLSSFAANAQNILSWEKWLGDTTRYESVHSVKQFPDGSIYLLGHADDTLNNPFVSLSKLDSAGNLLWVKKYGNAKGNPIGGEHLIITKDFQLVTIGSLYQNSGDYDELLTKLDSSGNILWQNLHGDVHRVEYPSFVEQTSDYGFIACGYISQTNLAGNDILVLKYAANGDLQWSKEFGGNANDAGNAVHQTADGGYILSGDTWQATLDNYVLKMDAAGSKTWDLTIGDSNANGNMNLLVNTDGDYILVGESPTALDPDFDIYMVKVTKAGNLAWAKYIGGSGTDAGFSVVENTSKEYIITGYSNSYNDQQPIKLMVCKTDSLGNSIYMNYLGSSSVNIGYEIIPSTNGGCLLAGFSMLNGNDQGYLAKINESAITSIAEQMKPGILCEIFPNPASNYIFIRGSREGRCFIYNEQGTQVMDVPASNKAIDISTLASGLYIAVTQTQEGISAKKFIKTN